MLRYIEISNIALIDSASIDFGTGLCVLTGETGAGKSIVIDSINAVLGARSTRDIVRKGADGAMISAIFSIGDLKAYGPLKAVLNDIAIGVSASGDAAGENPDDDELVLSRDISASGRSVCRVNGRIVATPTLRAIGELIVDLHGQHENHSLMKRGKHIEMIDNFGGAALLDAKERYGALYADYRRIKKQIADLQRSESERARSVDILTFQINEIKSIRPRVGEDARLLAQIDALANAEKINGALLSASAALSEGAGEAGGNTALINIAEAIRALSQITQYSDEYRELSDRLTDARYIVEDAAAALRRLTAPEELDPGRLDALSGRHEAIERLKRKYGGSIEDVHAFYKQAADKLSELVNSEQTAADLEKRLGDTVCLIKKRACELTDLRIRASEAIEAGVLKELADLEMKNCRFSISVASSEDIADYGPGGRDQLEFLFCANPGEELKPLTRIASGGEMSRVMLAIKSVLVGADNIPTMIFDEIDNGISGNAASRVAEKMHLLSRGRQIICVTHLAQIACMAGEQYMIEKTSTEDKTRTHIFKLNDRQRVDEISRMLGGGAPTEASLRLSGELLERASAYKSGAR